MNIFSWFKRKTTKEKTVPPIPKGQDGYLQWLYDNHPAYQEPAQKDEIGGPKGPEPTRYGTWERGGIDVDF